MPSRQPKPRLPQRQGQSSAPHCVPRGRGGLLAAAPVHPWVQGVPPPTTRSPRVLCQAPTKGPSRPASSHFCAQGPLSPARESNVPVSGDTSALGHERGLHSPFPSPWGCPTTPRAAQDPASRVGFVPKGLFRGRARSWGLPMPQVSGWSGARGGCCRLQALTSRSCARSRASSLGRLPSLSGFGLLNEQGFEL